MRLIDADRLLKGTDDHQFIDTHIIWNAPTVDAIPAEWIKLYMTTEMEKGDFMYACLCELLRDWRYANETD